MFRLPVPSRCGEGLALLFPSTLLRLPAALYGACPVLRAVPAFGCSTKARTWLRLHFVPSLAQAAQAARSLTGALSPGVARLLPSVVQLPFPPRQPSVSASACSFSPPSLQPQSPPSPVGCVCPVSIRNPPGGCQPPRISGSRNWRPVYSAVGDAVLGAKPAPFPSPLPPGFGRAGPVRSRLAPLDFLGPFVL